MKIGFYTSEHYYSLKKAALEAAMERLSIKADIIRDPSFKPQAEQAFGFEELFKRTKNYAEEMIKREAGKDIDVGIGVENALSYSYSADEWHYSICVALQTREGKSTTSFTPGISIPLWMVKDVQDEKIKLDVLTERIAGESDPVVYFSAKTLTRKDLMVPAFLLAFSNLRIGDRG